jgi:hypothetical protein
LHFLYGQLCWTLLHVFNSHLYLFFWELSVQFICSFISGLFVLLLLNFLNSLYIVCVYTIYIFVYFVYFVCIYIFIYFICILYMYIQYTYLYIVYVYTIYIFVYFCIFIYFIYFVHCNILNSLFYMIKDINPLSIEKLVKIFSRPVCWLLILVTVPFDTQKLLNSM